MKQTAGTVSRAGDGLGDQAVDEARGQPGDGPCGACEDARMVEYGNAVGQVSEQGGGAGGGSGGSIVGGGGPADLGATVADFVSDSANRIMALPPEGLLLLVVIVLASLVVLKRAF